MATTYDIGDTRRLTVTFRDLAGTLTNPTTATLTVKSPSGTETVYSSPTNDSVGVYHQDVPLTEAGLWYWRWKGTGAVAEAEEGTLPVRKSNFATP